MLRKATDRAELILICLGSLNCLLVVLPEERIRITVAHAHIHTISGHFYPIQLTGDQTHYFFKDLFSEFLVCVSVAHGRVEMTDVLSDVLLFLLQTTIFTLLSFFGASRGGGAFCVSEKAPKAK